MQNAWVEKFTYSDETSLHLSFSRLRKALDHSWRQYKHELDNPTPVGEGAHFSRLFHQMLLEDMDNVEVVYEPLLNHRTTEGKTAFASWASEIEKGSYVVAAHHSAKWMIEKLGRNDITIIEKDAFDKAKDMSEAVKKRVFWQRIKDDAVFETKGEFTHNDVTIRFVPDVRVPKHGIICDIKKMQKVTPRHVANEIFKWFLDIQAAIYIKGSEVIDERPYDRFYVIACEDVAPYNVQEYLIPTHVVQFAWDIVSKKIDEYKQCVLIDEWPEQSDMPIEAQWPVWMMSQREEICNEQ